MHIKTAGTEMKALLKAAQDEQAENLKKAKYNARCVDPSKLDRYESQAFVDLIRGTDALIDLVQGANGG